MELRLLGKEKLRSFWQILADIGLRLHAMACVRIRWHPVATDRIRWHTTACDGMQSVQCPAPRMKPNTLKMPLTMKVTVDMMACVIE